MDFRQMDYEVSRKIWESQVPIEFCLSNEDDSDSAPLYKMVPRCSYFAVILPKVLSFFSNGQKLEAENVWLESNRVPLKLYLPIGVLYDIYTASQDVTWSVNIRTGKPPENYVHINKESMESIFMQSIKEAAFLKRKIEVVNNMKTVEHKQLWGSVVNGRFDDFWSVGRKLMDTSDRNFESVPLRLYERDKPFRQCRLGCTDENGRLLTLDDALRTVLPTTESLENRSFVSHGVPLPLSTPLIYVAKNLAYPDNFIHVFMSD